MGLSVLHQTVNPVGATFTPNLLLYGWFTLHWNRNASVFINTPTSMTNGQEFIIDVIRHNASPMPDGDPPIVEWESSAFLPSITDDEAYTSPWTGFGLYSGCRHHFLVLNGICTLESRNSIPAY